MKFSIYLQDRAGHIVCSVLFLLFFWGLLSVTGTNHVVIAFLAVLYIILTVTVLMFEYGKKYKFYRQVTNNLNNLDQKFLIHEMLPYPGFGEGKILCQCIQSAGKSMNDEIAKYRIDTKEYREYIELWIHEVKTPLASSRLIMENNPGKLSDSLNEELNIVDYYLEQVLFYSRSSYVEKDYSIRKILLEQIVNAVIRKNSRDFIRNKVKLELSVQDIYVYTDSKWMEFILNQIIVNAIKYRKSGTDSHLSVQAEERNNSILIFIQDNGIGMNEKDAAKAFEKGYTGDTGRKYAKSTGIGLYLCKKLCEKLGISISLSSELGVGTEIQIHLPKMKDTQSWELCDKTVR